MSQEFEIWVLHGIIDHNHSENDLRAVVKRHMKINQVPKGYHYPELLRHGQLSFEMQEMLKRKAQHQNDQDR